MAHPQAGHRPQGASFMAQHDRNMGGSLPISIDPFAED
jgi:hypothetical protein